MQVATFPSQHDAAHVTEGYIHRFVQHDPPITLVAFDSSKTIGDVVNSQVGYVSVVDESKSDAHWRGCWRFQLLPEINWTFVTKVTLRWMPKSIQVYAGHSVTQVGMVLYAKAGSSGNLWSLDLPDAADFGPTGMVLVANPPIPWADWCGSGVDVPYEHIFRDAELEALRVLASGKEWLFIQARPNVTQSSDTGVRVTLYNGNNKVFEVPLLTIETRSQSPRESIYQLFVTGWGTTTHYEFDNENANPDTDVWVNVVVLHLNSMQDTIGHAGNRRFMEYGKAVVEIRTLTNIGTEVADALALLVRTIFEGTSYDGIQFKATTTRPVAPDGKWNRVNVETPFTYEVKK